MAQPQKVQTTTTRKPKTGIGRAVPAPNPAANDFPGEQAPEFQSLAVAEFDGEPRVRDLDLAERLGFDRPRKIRELIERNMAEIEGMGSLAPQRGKSRGQAFTEYWLDESQALLVAAISMTPQARAVRAMLVRTFVAYRRGQIDTAIPGDLAEEIHRILGINKMLSHKVTVIERNMEAMQEQHVAALVALDPRVAALAYVSVNEILDKEWKVPPKGRRSIQRRVLNRLKDYCATGAMKGTRAAYSGTWIFPRQDAIDFVHKTCGAMIRDHIDKVTGQTVLKLVRTQK